MAAQQQQQQPAGAGVVGPYAKVAAWLSSTYNSSGSKAAGRPAGAPLMSRLSSSLLWYVGLGSALHKQQQQRHRPHQHHHHHNQQPERQQAPQRGQQQRPQPGQQPDHQQQQQQSHPIQQQQSTPAAAAETQVPAQPPPPVPLPVGSNSSSKQGVILHSAANGPGSHPLSMQQVEQSMMGFSSSSSSSSSSAAAAVTAPAQAAGSALKSRSVTYLGPAGAAALKMGDDIMALLASVPRTMRTLQWAVQAGINYKRLLSRLDAQLNPDAYMAQLSRLHDVWAQRLTEVCRTNGGVYVKAGQFAAAFGAVPPEYRKHLALLQDKAKPQPFHVVDRVLRLELGAGAEEVFAEFSAEATAAASLAQVHKARLTDGRQVAVKVQYPGLRGAANADLTTLSLLSAAAAALFPEFRLSWLYDELRLKLTEELDFQIELHNAQRLMACLHPSGASSRASSSSMSSMSSSSSDAGSSSSSSSSTSTADSSNSVSSRGGRRGADCVTVPKAHVALCTSKILTMEWIDGVKVNDTQGLRAAQINPREVGRVVDDAFAEMTFIHGFIHADPHPGNVMVRPKGRRGILSWLARGTWQPFEVVLLDHGTYLSIADRLRQQYCQLWCSLFVGDTATAASVAIELGGQRAGQILPVILTQRGRTKEEQKQMQRAAGVASFGDITQLLSTAPRDVVELLRIAAVVRNVTASLSCTLAERLRISGTWALRGLPGYWSDDTQHQQAATEADKKFAQAGYRLNIRARLLLIRSYVALNTVLNRALLATLYAFGQPVAMY